ncbi:MAG: acid phosphatase [Mycobacterium sp.]|nr:acid phosphatase [Mycobacterium sp.]
MRRPRRRKYRGLRVVGLLSTLAACAVLASSATTQFATAVDLVGFSAAVVPAPAHIVVVVEENRSHTAVIGNKSAPYINSLAAEGATMTQSFAQTHSSEPNYFALFAGSTLGLKENSCPVNAGTAANLGSELLAAGYTFVGFAEDLPAVGSQACNSGQYARKHVPWVSFTNIPRSCSVPSAMFPDASNYASLPTVSFVIPNLANDMHDGSIAQADNWLYQELSSYASWAKDNNSLLILTWDEGDDTARNQIPTIIYGAHVKTGTYGEPISHYNVLSTVEQMYGLSKTGNAAKAPAITDIWDS